jgi:YgiT-type zinc finger domain-containing protein
MMKDRFNSSDQTIPCSECQAGQMHRQYVAYYTWIGDDLITVPDFPAWVCDFCGRREYDMSALSQLSLILSPNAGSTPAHRRQIPHHPRPKPKNPRASQPD